MVLDILPQQQPTALIRNRLLSVGLFTTLAETLWTTVLIAYRIYSVSSHIMNRARPHFYNILEMITQSSFLYSLALRSNAVLAVVPQKQSDVWTIFTVGNYVGVTLYAVTVCPTIRYEYFH